MADPERRLILFARFPIAGKVKTRLIPPLGAEGAAALYRRLVLRSLRTAHAFCRSQGVELEIRCAGDDADAMQHWLGDAWLCRPQCEGDLGRRMAGAFADSFGEGSPATVIIGSDCPSLTPEILAAAFESLKAWPVVLGPATDGGYYLIGLNGGRPGRSPAVALAPAVSSPTPPGAVAGGSGRAALQLFPELFEGIAWGTETVLAQSLENLARGGVKAALLQPLDDLDRPEDLAAWQRMVQADEAGLRRVSVIIPALNEAAHIAGTLEHARQGSPHEIIVVDGGSTDDTTTVTEQNGANVIHSKPGRARQMNAGAARATGDVLLFLHADTLLPGNWTHLVTDTLKTPGVVAGSFQFRLSDNFAGCWLVERMTNLRSRWFQNPYGDQTQFLRRALFEELGGFSDLPIMEDCDLNRRLRKLGRVATAREAATTSGRRWKRLGVIRTTLINQMVIAGFQLGVCPHRLARFYRRSPKGN